MKNKIILPVLVTAINAMLFSNSYATNLIQVYNQALKSDPSFMQAEATWLSNQSAVGISRAALLPSISSSGGWSYVHTRNSVYRSATISDGSYNSFTYGLSLTQPIFNYASWSKLNSAQNSAKSYEASYNAAAQALISRVVSSYLNVLNSYNTLHNDLTKKNADYQQYITTKQQFKVGLKAVTDVYTAQSAYDADVATVIGDRNDVDNKLESLREITGTKYQSLNDIAKQIPLQKPQPNKINQWTKKTQQQNYLIKADQFSLLAAKEDIKTAYSGHLPTLSLSGDLQGSHNTDTGKNMPIKNSFQGSVGVTASLPIFSGGSIVAATKQKRYAYLSSSDQLQIDSRTAISTSRKAYLAIIQDIAKVKADYEGIISSNKALTSTEAGYRVGTMTMYNVLDAINQVSTAQQKYYSDQYDYLQQMVTLKLQAGILNIDDVKQINSLLTKRINFNKKTTSQHHIDKLKHKITTKPMYIDNNDHPPLKAGDYTIQLFASQSLHNSQSFYHLRNKKHQLYLIKVSGDGKKTSYKVTYGSYPSYIVAKRALQKMPRNYRLRFKPWIINYKQSDATILPAAEDKSLPAPDNTENIKKNPSQKTPSATTANQTQTNHAPNINKKEKSATTAKKPVTSSTKKTTPEKNHNNTLLTPKAPIIKNMPPVQQQPPKDKPQANDKQPPEPTTWTTSKQQSKP